MSQTTKPIVMDPKNDRLDEYQYMEFKRTITNCSKSSKGSWMNLNRREIKPWLKSKKIQMVEWKKEGISEYKLNSIKR